MVGTIYYDITINDVQYIWSHYDYRIGSLSCKQKCDIIGNYYYYQPGSNIMHTLRHRRSGCRCSMGPWRLIVMQLTALFDGSLAINRGWSLIHSNKHSCG